VEGVGSVKREFLNKKPYPSENGFFFEISKGAVCAGNIFVNCDQGIFILNSSNVQVYQNTFINSTVCIGRNERSPVNDGTFGWHSGTGPDVSKRCGHVFVNNLLTADKNYHRPLLLLWQPDSMNQLFDGTQLKQFNYNMFVRNSNKNSNPLILWTPAINSDSQISFESLEELQKMYPEFSTHNQYFADDVPLFKSRELRNYQLLQTFPGYKIASLLPAEISKLLGFLKKDIRYIGAYPPLP
jgi:parallel beta-helix repeat protein